jgi:phage tail-like protein
MATFPVGAFNFEVKIDGSAMAFQEVSGLDITITTKELHRGSNHAYQRKVPDKVTFTDLVLKRGIAPSENKVLLNWIKQIINGIHTRQTSPISKTIIVTLLDEKSTPVWTWTFHNAYPIKWSIGKINAQENAIAFESVTFTYYYMEMS